MVGKSIDVVNAGMDVILGLSQNSYNRTIRVSCGSKLFLV
jgi:hypothetical protein